MMSILRICMLLLVAFGAPAVVSADAKKPDKVARAHFEKGRQLAAKSKFVEAYAEFEAGYKANPLPAFLFNMGEAARGMGDAAKARAAYEQFLAVESTGSVADTARQRLADLDRTHPVPAPAPEPAPEPAPAPQQAPAPVAPTPAETAARVEAKAEARPVTPTPKAESTPLWKKWPLWAAVGGAVAAAVVIGVVVTRDGGDVMCNVGCVDLR